MKARQIPLIINVLAIAICFLIQAYGVSAYQYEVTYYMTGGSGTSIDTDDIPFGCESGDINLSLNMRAKFNTSSSFTYDGLFESPYSSTFGITSGSGSTNTSCRNLGTASKSYSDPTLVSTRNTLTNDADSATVYSQSTYRVTTSDRWINIFSNNETDSEGYVPNVYRRVTSGLTEPPTPAELTNEFPDTLTDDCGSVGNLDRFPGSYSLSTKQEIGFVIVNSTAGTINYSMFVGAGLTSRYIYFPLDDESAVTDLGTGTGGKSGSVTLDENRLYVFGYGTSLYNTVRSGPQMNFTIDLGIADYSCGSWGECTDGYYERTCVDLNGLQPDRIDTSACSLVVLENATLGFEEYTTYDDVLKCAASLFCNIGADNTDYLFGYNVTRISVDRPANWTIVDPAYGKAYFLKMTSEWSAERSRSLKMWTIPPKEHEVLGWSNGSFAYCGNLTSSIVPQLHQNISNDSFAVSYDVTFPSEYMQLGFSVKKCETNELQNSNLGGVLWANESGEETYIIPPTCYKRCYGNSCEEEPNGRYYFNIIDTVTSQSIFGGPIYKEAQLKTSSPLYSLSGLGIIPGRNYRLVFSVINENQQDSTGNCVYFDDVHYQTTTAALTALVQNCESRCDGLTRYEASRTASGSCFIEIIEFSEKCAATTELQEALLNYYDFCDPDNSTLLHRFDNYSGDYYDINCPYGCNDATCLTEEEYTEEEAALSLYDPPEIIGQILTAFGITVTDYGYVWFFFSLFMLVNYFALGLGVGVGKMVMGNSKESKDFYLPFMVTVIIILVSATFGGVYPLEVGIPIIVAIGIMLWKTSEKLVSGGGGG